MAFVENFFHLMCLVLSHYFCSNWNCNNSIILFSVVEFHIELAEQKPRELFQLM